MKSTVEILDQRFRLAMKDGRIDPKTKYDIIELTVDQKNVIMEYLKNCGKSVTNQEIELCFKSFMKEYWKRHRLPPRTKEASHGL